VTANDQHPPVIRRLVNDRLARQQPSPQIALWSLLSVNLDVVPGLEASCNAATSEDQPRVGRKVLTVEAHCAAKSHQSHVTPNS
jgi:hypothetical protein